VEAGADVIITGRTPEHGQQAVAQLNELASKSKGGNATFKQVDFEDIKAVDDFAKEVASQEDRLDILINNAGLGQTPHQIGKCGMENKYLVRQHG
jgi:NAD(P)-dependent dehydrogenase (short-subunit alcohol dehydrogenase family)